MQAKWHLEDSCQCRSARNARYFRCTTLKPKCSARSDAPPQGQIPPLRAGACRPEKKRCSVCLRRTQRAAKYWDKSALQELAYRLSLTFRCGENGRVNLAARRTREC